MNRWKMALFWAALFVLSLGFLGVFWVGKHYELSEALIQFIQIIFVFVGLWGSLKILNRVVWPGYEMRFGKPIPHLIIDISNFCMIAGAIFIITVFVLKQSPFSFFAAGGLITAALALSLQGLIQDIFAALVLDVDVPFKIGDWIKLNSGAEGRVVNIAWRHTSLLTTDETIVYIPNGQLIRDQFTNLSQPNSWYWDTLNVTIDHGVPSDRVKRILESAVSKLTSIHDHTCLVYAVQPSERGIQYAICYGVPHPNQWPQVRHDVIQSVCSALHDYGLKISQALGEYAFARGKNNIISTPNITNEDIIRLNNIFRGASEGAIHHALQLGRRLLLDEGEVILNKGDEIKSMYLVGEGAVSLVHDKKATAKEIIVTFPDFFGEQCILGESKSTHLIKAKTKAILWEISEQTVREILQQYPEIITPLSQMIANHGFDERSLSTHWPKHERIEKKELIEILSTKIRKSIQI